MKTLFAFTFIFIFSFAFSQDIELIKLYKNIKDKRGLIKSLSVIDNRPDKNIGTLSDSKKTVSLKFENEDLKSYIENWFNSDNKTEGNTDLVLMIEEIKSYQEQNLETNESVPKLKVKISSFIKRNDKYYFINRFDNIAIVPINRAAFSQDYFADQISNLFTNFIKSSYTSTVSSYVIPENEINNYNNYLVKNSKALNSSELKDGFYKNFKNFSNQEPDANYTLERNKKGKPKRLKYNGEQVPFSEIYGFVENGKVYKLTPVGFDEMQKDEKGFHLYTSRNNIFLKNSNNVMIGAMAGGMVGALIGGIIDANSNNNSGGMIPFGYSNHAQCIVYIDSLTGDYVFTQ